MECERYLDELADERGGDTPLPGYLRRHLDGCPGCRRFHASLRRGRVLLRSLPSVPVRDDFFERLEQRIERVEHRRRTLRRTTAAAVRTVAAGLVAAALVYVLAPGAASRRASHDALDGRTGRSGPPAVSVLRPFARLVGGEEAALFAAPAELLAGPGELEARPLSGAQGRFDPLLLGLLPAGAAAVAAADAGRVYDRLQAGVSQPVLVATPSWSFAASPGAFQFVTARSRPTFPRAGR